MKSTKIVKDDGLTVGQREKKYFSKYKKPALELPNLFEGQIESFNALLKDGLKEVFKEFSSIEDYTGKKYELQFGDLIFEDPKLSSKESRFNHLTYEAILKVRAKLINKVLGTQKEQDIFLTEFPIMTRHGTFIINGVERVIVPQLARSYGVLFTTNLIRGRILFGSKIIPSRGAWIEFETDQDNVVYVRIDRNRKFLATTFLRVLGAHTDSDILNLFKGKEKAIDGIKKTLAKDSVKEVDVAYLDVYKRLRDGDLINLENAREFVDSILSEERYDLSEVGRFKFNNRFGLPTDKKALQKKNIDKEDIAIIISHIVELNHNPDALADDIDHLGSRRVRFVGELLQQKVRVGLAQMKRNIQNRMSTIDNSNTLPANFVTARPLQARIKEFFTTNQLSQFLQQENMLVEIESLRTVSALGPGGLSRERAGLEVRDVHPSHYGRVCPIQTPEGQNIGLILRLSCYARTNKYGMIETPYVKVENGKITNQIVYMNAHEEEKYAIAHAAVKIDENNNFVEKYITVRMHGMPNVIKNTEVDFIDVAPNQAFSIATSMIPFLDHDDANRALMASNMQKQAVPVLKTEAPLVATGREEEALKYSNRVIRAEEAGVVEFVDARKISINTGKSKNTDYELDNLRRTNSFTVFGHRPIVNVGDRVKKGDLLADTTTSDNGQIALGKNLLVAFMSWSGSNYEDAIILSQRIVKDDVLTSIYMEEVVVNVRDTRLGPEVTTSDIPNVGDSRLKNLDEDGIIRIGAEVRPGDILVGKIIPKGETQLTLEER
ncbi:MAG TPA: DNA-directed RNA polymerase subunit beta, partial [Candidatus Paceibacterota bacterium]|nr:DNA-directed RNA polymerase subunit beta [Candidatus Paceibacterota bacterium]